MATKYGTQTRAARQRSLHDDTERLAACVSEVRQAIESLFQLDRRSRVGMLLNVLRGRVFRRITRDWVRTALARIENRAIPPRSIEAVTAMIDALSADAVNQQLSIVKPRAYSLTLQSARDLSALQERLRELRSLLKKLPNDKECSIRDVPLDADQWRKSTEAYRTQLDKVRKELGLWSWDAISKRNINGLLVHFVLRSRPFPDSDADSHDPSNVVRVYDYHVNVIRDILRIGNWLDDELVKGGPKLYKCVFKDPSVTRVDLVEDGSGHIVVSLARAKPNDGKLAVPAYRVAEGCFVEKMRGLAIRRKPQLGKHDIYRRALWRTVFESRQTADTISQDMVCKGEVVWRLQNKEIPELTDNKDYIKTLCDLFCEPSDTMSPGVGPEAMLLGNPAKETAREYLGTLGFVFDSAPAKPTYHFSGESEHVGKREGLSYVRDSSRQCLSKPFWVVDVGRRPERFLDLIDSLRDWIPEQLREVVGFFHKETSWYWRAHGASPPSVFIERLADLIKALARQPEEFESIRNSLVQTINARGLCGAGFLEVKLPGDAPAEWDWCASTSPNRPLRSQVGIVIAGKVYNNPQRVLSRGMEKPRLLDDLHPVQPSDSLRGDRSQRELARALLLLLPQREELSPDHPDVLDILTLIGGRFYPQPGEDSNRFRNDPPKAWKYDDALPPGVCIAVHGHYPAICLVRENTLIEVGVPTSIVLSRGKEPSLFALVQKLIEYFRGEDVATDLADVEVALADARGVTVSRGIPVRLTIAATKLMDICLRKWNETASKDWAKRILELQQALEEVDALSLPRFDASTSYCFEDIQRQVKARDGRQDVKMIFEPPEEEGPHVSQPAGEICELRAFACIVDGQILRKAKWVKSTGQVTPQLLLASNAMDLLSSKSVAAFLKDDALERAKQAWGEIRSLASSCIGGEQWAKDSANRALLAILSQVDAISDVADDLGDRIHLFQERAIGLLVRAGTLIRPEWPAALSAPASDPNEGYVEHNVMGPAGIRAVLSRQASIGDAPISTGPAIYFVGTGADANDQDWQLIKNLYSALRMHYTSLREFEQFYRARDVYARTLKPSHIPQVISKAEAMAEKKPPEWDPPEIRSAITEIERRLGMTIRYQRVHYDTWQRFPLADAKRLGYEVRPMKIEGMSSRLVVRIVEPAYLRPDDQSPGETIVGKRGRIIITS